MKFWHFFKVFFIFFLFFVFKFSDTSSQEIWEAKKRIIADLTYNGSKEVIVFYQSSDLAYFSVFAENNKILYKSPKNKYAEIKLVIFDNNKNFILVNGNDSGINFLEIYGYLNNNLQKVFSFSDFSNYTLENLNNKNLLVLEKDNTNIKYEFVNNAFTKILPEENKLSTLPIKNVKPKISNIYDLIFLPANNYLVVFYKNSNNFYFIVYDFNKNQIKEPLFLKNIKYLKLLGNIQQDLICYLDNETKSISKINVNNGEIKEILPLKIYSNYTFTKNNFNNISQNLLFAEDENIYLLNLETFQKTFIVRGVNPLYLYNQNKIVYKIVGKDTFHLLDLEKLNYEDIDFKTSLKECIAKNNIGFMACYNNNVILAYNFNSQSKNIIYGYFPYKQKGYFKIDILESENLIINYFNEKENVLYYYNFKRNMLTKLEENVNNFYVINNQVYFSKKNNIFIFSENNFTLQKINLTENNITNTFNFKYEEDNYFIVQLLAKDNINGLSEEIDKLRTQGITDTFYIITYLTNNIYFYRLRTGLFKDKDEAAIYAEKFTRNGISLWITKETRGKFIEIH